MRNVVVALIVSTLTSVSVQGHLRSVDAVDKQPSTSTSSNLRQLAGGLGRESDEFLMETMKSQLDEGGYPMNPTVFNEHVQFIYKSSPDPRDLSIRFNKVGEVLGATPVTLGPHDFPISVETAGWLRRSDCWSVIAQGDCRPEDCQYDIHDLLSSIGGLPSHPLNETQAHFWEEFRHVVEIQKMRRGGNVGPESVMSMPDIWDGYNMDAVAEAVHDEYPGENQARVIDLFINASVPMDTDIIPTNSRTEFLRYNILLGHINTFVIAAVAPQNFQMKYHVGRARPEEVAWIISEGLIGEDNGVPADIIADILAMNLQRAEDFTAYPEGCPNHPSWPAMHSAASSASLWLPVVMNLSSRQLCEIRRVDYAVSFGRTVAGVHYHADNIAGLNLGQEIVARKLPRYLAYFYGSDPQAVRRKIATLRFDWATFTQSRCYLDKSYASVSE